jgi:hypothetical protein
MPNTVGIRTSTQIIKEINREIIPLINASNGGILRKYCDWKVIKGESRVITKGSAANYSRTAPNLYGPGADAIDGLGGQTSTYEVSPRYIYGWEVLTQEQLNIMGSITGDEWFMQGLVKALEIGEDIEIVEAIERADTLLPTENVYSNVAAAIFDSSNIEMFKKYCAYASGRWNNTKTVSKARAVVLMHAVDWSSVIERNDAGNIFSNSDYSQVTGVNGIIMNMICGCALELFYDLDRPYGDAGRTALIPKGTVRIITSGNILGASWESSVRTEALSSMLNGDTTKIVVSKSVGAKLVEPAAAFKLSFKVVNLNQVS